MERHLSISLLVIVIFFASACQNKEFDKDVVVNVKIAGSYHSLLHSEDSTTSCDVTLTLAMDSTAIMSIKYGTEETLTVSKGKWYHEREKIILQMDTINGEPMLTDEIFLFELINEDLVALEYDTTNWGSEGFELKKK